MGTENKHKARETQDKRPQGLEVIHGTLAMPDDDFWITGCDEI